MTTQEQDFLERIMAANSELRNEIHRMSIFIKALTDPEMYGHAVSAEVRNAASLFIRQMERK